MNNNNEEITSSHFFCISTFLTIHYVKVYFTLFCCCYPFVKMFFFVLQVRRSKHVHGSAPKKVRTGSYPQVLFCIQISFLHLLCLKRKLYHTSRLTARRADPTRGGGVPHDVISYIWEALEAYRQPLLVASGVNRAI